MSLYPNNVLTFVPDKKHPPPHFWVLHAIDLRYEPHPVTLSILET